MGAGGEGEDLGDQFSLILTPARPDTQAKSVGPGGGKGKKGGTVKEGKPPQRFVTPLLLRPARLHHSISFSPLPEEAAVEARLLESGRLPPFWSKKRCQGEFGGAGFVFNVSCLRQTRRRAEPVSAF